MCGRLGPRITQKSTSAIGMRQFSVVVSLLHSVIHPEILTQFMDIASCALPCPKTQEHQSTFSGLLGPYGIRKWISAIGTRRFSMTCSLSNIVI